jgi:hypothetical protein
MLAQGDCKVGSEVSGGPDPHGDGGRDPVRRYHGPQLDGGRAELGGNAVGGISDRCGSASLAILHRSVQRMALVVLQKVILRMRDADVSVPHVVSQEVCTAAQAAQSPLGGLCRKSCCHYNTCALI